MLLIFNKKNDSLDNRKGIFFLFLDNLHHNSKYSISNIFTIKR